VATGTSTTGVVDLPNTCHDWTDGTSPLLDVAMGIPATTEGDWTLTTTRSAVYTYTQCGYPTHRYCFGVDHVTPLPPSADAGRLAFVTAQTFSPGGGIAAADALCDSEARAGGLTGSFAALLASSTQSAADRFAPFWGRTWIRTDGVALNDPGEILFDQPELRAPLNATSTKTVVAGDVFTGAESVGAVGQPASTCQDWTSTAGTTRGGRSSNLARWWSGRGVACSAPQHLYCFQR
jgi:hypothetical protein